MNLLKEYSLMSFVHEVKSTFNQIFAMLCRLRFKQLRSILLCYKVPCDNNTSHLISYIDKRNIDLAIEIYCVHALF